MEHITSYRPAKGGQLMIIIRFSFFNYVARMAVLYDVFSIPYPIVRIYVRHVILAFVVLIKLLERCGISIYRRVNLVLPLIEDFLQLILDNRIFVGIWQVRILLVY